MILFFLLHLLFVSHFDGIYINDWSLRLCYGSHTTETCLITSIELNSLILPIVIKNKYTNTLKTSFLVEDFHGIRSFNDVKSMTLLNKSLDQQ